jgi:nicotinamide-nucleotide amidase
MKEAEAFVEYLIRHELQLTTAESCTAGMIVELTADVEGCGDTIESGYVVYSISAKKRLLGVQQATIDQYNLTSEQVAREMAEGALRDSTANSAISTTGIAGPDAVDGIPAGTICFAWGFLVDGATLLFSGTRQFDGDRRNVRKQAALYAMNVFMGLHSTLR